MGKRDQFTLTLSKGSVAIYLDEATKAPHLIAGIYEELISDFHTASNLCCCERGESFVHNLRFSLSFFSNQNSGLAS